MYLATAAGCDAVGGEPNVVVRRRARCTAYFCHRAARRWRKRKRRVLETHSRRESVVHTHSGRAGIGGRVGQRKGECCGTGTGEIGYAKCLRECWRGVHVERAGCRDRICACVGGERTDGDGICVGASSGGGHVNLEGTGATGGNRTAGQGHATGAGCHRAAGTGCGGGGRACGDNPSAWGSGVGVDHAGYVYRDRVWVGDGDGEG